MKKKLLLSLAMIAMVMGLQAKTVKTSFKVNGACDEMCKPRITKAARGVKGVLAASWNSKTKSCKVVYDSDKTSVAQIEKAVAAAGHDAGNVKASAAAYNKLPSCCKYRSGTSTCDNMHGASSCKM